jgi:PAS domain S-box-containing protein
MLSFDAFLAQFTSVMDHVPSGVLISLDPAGRTLVANRAARDLLGVPRHDDVASNWPPFRTPLTGRKVAWSLLPLRRAMDANAAIPAADYEILRSDGVQTFATMSAAPLRDDEGRVQGGIAVLVDVTYLRTLETDLRQERDELSSRFVNEKHIAETFQSAQLPNRLPRVSGFVLSALYRPADAAARVGGDWYDAFPLPDGRIGLSIGDVMGHGLDAAVTMGKLRQAIQSAAFVNPDPPVILDAASSTLMLHDRDMIASAIAAILTPHTATLTFAAAGHPLPLIRRRDATLLEFHGTAAPLGLSARCDAQRHTAELMPGDIAVFYTDGLIEATRDADIGERMLRTALASSKSLGSEDAASRLHERVLGRYDSPDDVAILTVERRALRNNP